MPDYPLIPSGPFFESSPYIDRRQQFEEYLRDGIYAVKEGRREQALRLLGAARDLNPHDARLYIWLSATTDDPQAQLDYLEKALALEPINAIARRGIAMLTGRPDPFQPAQPPGALPAAEAPAVSGEQVFTCPQCNGRMSFDLQHERLTCEYCGYQAAAGAGEEDRANQEYMLDYFKSAQHGLAWSPAEQQFKCARCGALSLIPGNQPSIQCPYCASNQLLPSQEHSQLLPPTAILLMKLDERAAAEAAYAWLGWGLFAPDDLHGSHHSLRLRPAYYSCWTFDGTIEIKWESATVERTGSASRLVPTQEVELRFFNDVLVSGVSVIPDRHLERLGPFDLSQAEGLQPAHLAGWPAILYDVSLAQASSRGREKALRQSLRLAPGASQPDLDRRELKIRSSSWSGMTYRHILVPLWLGEYRFQGRFYRLYINGQSGGVTGEKPVDRVKILLSVLSGLLLLGLLLYLLAGGLGK